jgi:hypothetical protein
MSAYPNQEINFARLLIGNFGRNPVVLRRFDVGLKRTFKIEAVAKKQKSGS